MEENERIEMATLARRLGAAVGKEPGEVMHLLEDVIRPDDPDSIGRLQDRIMAQVREGEERAAIEIAKATYALQGLQRRAGMLFLDPNSLTVVFVSRTGVTRVQVTKLRPSVRENETVISWFREFGLCVSALARALQSLPIQEEGDDDPAQP